MIKFCSQLIIAFLLLSVPGLTHPPSGGGGGEVSTAKRRAIARLDRHEQVNPE